MIVVLVRVFRRRGSFGMLAHQMAALEGHVSCLKNLLSTVPDFDINATDNCGHTCLHCGACGGCVLT
jgi:ankyrin repeat protein